MEEAKRLSLVKMSAIDRNSLVPFDRDLEYTIEGANDIRTGENAIIPSSMSYFLGWNYCGAALYLVPGKQLIYDWKRSIEPYDN